MKGNFFLWIGEEVPNRREQKLSTIERQNQRNNCRNCLLLLNFTYISIMKLHISSYSLSTASPDTGAGGWGLIGAVTEAGGTLYRAAANHRADKY